MPLFEQKQPDQTVAEQSQQKMPDQTVQTQKEQPDEPELRQKQIQEFLLPYKAKLTNPDLKEKLIFRITKTIFERNRKLQDDEIDPTTISKKIADDDEQIRLQIEKFLEDNNL